MTNASQVQYTGVNLTYIGVTANQALDVILGEINTAVNNISPAPNYSAYSLGCVRTQVGTIDTTQQFAEGISGLFCTLQGDYTTFTGTTYPAAIETLTTAVNGLQVPGVTYTPFSITNTSTLIQVLDSMFTGFNTLGFNTLTSTLDPYSSNWSSISITPSHSIITTWNNVISYLSSLTTSIAGKQATIGTFNNTSNCLAGGATDSIFTTVGELITKVCSLPVYTSGSITWHCLTQGGALQSDIQNLVTAISAIQTNYVTAAADSSLTYAPITSCAGYSLKVNTGWSGLYNIAVDNNDTTPGNLYAKLTAGTGIGLSITNIDGNETVEITNSSTDSGEILVNSSDSTKGYIQNKLSSTISSWGMSIQIAPNSSNSQLVLSVNVTDPTMFFSSMFNAVSTDPSILAGWCTVSEQCSAPSCNAPTGLAVSFTTGPNVFDLTWTIASGSQSQTVQYRQRGNSSWINNVNIVAANPQTNSTTSATVTNLLSNIVYQFQIVNNCSGGSNGSSISENIIFACQSLTTSQNGGFLSVNQQPLPTIDSIVYQLIDNNGTVVDTEYGTGTNPNVNFTSQSAGTYHVTWYYAATVNGITVYSNAAGQLNALCSLTGIVLT